LPLQFRSLAGAFVNSSCSANTPNGAIACTIYQPLTSLVAAFDWNLYFLHVQIFILVIAMDVTLIHTYWYDLTIFQVTVDCHHEPIKIDDTGM
jgi:hypothetical protein